MKRGLAQTIRKRIVVEDIEPRILYSADALAVSQLLVDDSTANNQLVLVLDAESQQSNNATQQPPVGNNSQSETTQNTASADTQNTTTEANTEVDSAQQQTRKEIVFVDTRVADYQLLVDDILAKATQGQSIEVVMIRDNEDGLQAILDTLKERGQVDAIHLLGEGANAQLTLGNCLLTSEQLSENSELFKKIGQYLTADADILIYGCNFAQDATGQAMVQTLADLTGADVAASDDLTGYANLNGDWVLEYYAGKIETAVAIAQDTQTSWQHVMGIPDNTNNQAPVITLTNTNLVTNPSFENGTTGWSGNNDVEVSNQPSNYGITASPYGSNFAEVEGSVNTINSAANLIQNGSFENVAGLTSSTYGYYGNAAIAGWTDSRGLELQVHNINRGGIVASDGSNWLDLEASPSSNLVGQNVVGVETGKTYTLSFNAGDVADNFDGGPDDNTITVLWGGEVVGTINPTDGTMSQYQFNLIGGAGDGSNRLEFEGGGLVDGIGVSLDSVSLTATSSLYLEQTIATEVGQTYTFSLSAVSRNDVNVGDAGELLVNGVSVYTFKTSANWETYAVTFTATSTSSTIRIASLGSDSGTFSGVDDTAGLLIDNVSVVKQTATLNYVENASPVVLASQATVFDSSLSQQNNFNGSTLTLQRNGSANSEDLFGASGTLSNMVQGSSLVVGGNTIGTVTQNSGGVLSVTFSANASNALVNLFVQQITYANSSDSPVNSIQLDFTLNDGNTGAQGLGGAQSVTSSVIINVTSVNDAPSGTNNTITTNEETAYTFTAANVGFSDVDGNSLSAIKITTLPASGTLTLNGVAVTAGQTISATDINAGLLVFTPANNANGNNYGSFTFQVQDNGDTANGGENLDQSPNAITFNVTPSTDLVANNDSAAGAEDTVINGNVSLNDSTTSGGVLTYAVATGPSNGNLTFNADGTYSYQGDADYNGLDSFTYTVTDALSGESLTRTVSLTVSQVNDVGLFSGNLIGVGNEDTTITGTVSFADSKDGYATSNFALQTNAANGTASINGLGQWTYTPNANFNGTDSFTIYTIDDDGNVETQLITVTVNPVTDLVANNDSATGAEDTVINGNVSLNDSTTSGGVLTYAVATGPSNGNLTFNADGTYNYQGNADYNGLDSFTYTVTDAVSGDSLTRTVSLTITQVNDAGLFSGNLSGTASEDTTITGTINFADSRDGYTTTNYALQTNAANGVASVNSLGQWTYTPNANFSGSDSFIVLSTDDDGNVETQVITISVQTNNDVPTSSDTTIRFDEDSYFVSTLPSANDTDGGTITYAIFSQPTHGTVTVNSDGSFSFTPASNYNGTDQFSFMISDGQGGTAVYLVSATIDPVNDSPSTSTVTLSSMAEDTTHIITQAQLLANATDVDGDTLTVTDLQISSGNGNLINNGNGSWTYTPALNDDSSVSFAFTISDGQASSSSFSTLDITPLDDVILNPDTDGGGSSGGSSGGTGSGGGGNNQDNTKDNTSVNPSLYLLLENHQTFNDNKTDSISSKENTQLFDVADKVTRINDVQNASFITPIYKTNEGDDINLISAKMLGSFAYGHSANEGENTLVGGLKYDQKIVFATNALEEQLGFKEFKVNFDTGAQVSTVILSAGVMAWATQFTGLFASLFASLPSWAALDPLPILNKVDDEDELDEETDLETNEDDDFIVNRMLG